MKKQIDHEVPAAIDRLVSEERGGFASTVRQRRATFVA
jgi:hypothetical protein